jgi:uncharacterized protein YjbJ (UPF0337 family)
MPGTSPGITEKATRIALRSIQATETTHHDAAVPIGTFELPARYKTIATQEEMAMDWNRIEGNWKQFKGAAKEKWGKLTDDDLNVIEGRREQLEGKLQQRYGFAKDQIHKDVDDWFRTLK